MKKALILAIIALGNGSSAETTISRKTRELAAIQTQDRSIQKLESILRSNPNDPKKPAFLNRLADLYLEKSGISFQYTEGESVRTHQKQYSKSLQHAVRVLDQLIRDYPNQPKIAEAIFKRARANKELGKIESSKKDLLRLVEQYPGFDWMDSALLDLSMFAQDTNQHQEALRYLNQLMELKDSPYFAVACRKAAWSRFNLGQYRSAMNQLEREISYYQKENKSPPEAESAWHDAALFSFEALNRRMDVKEAEESIQWIEQFCSHESDQRVGNCNHQSLLKFGRLLKAYQLGNDLQTLRHKVIRKYAKNLLSTEVTLLLHQFWMEKREFGKIAELLEESVKSDPQAILKVTKESIAELHSITSKNLKSTRVQELLDPLNQLTHLYLRYAEEQDPSTGEFRFAMAESSFAARKFSLATDWYQSLIDHEKTIPKKWSVASIRIRLVASAHEELKIIAQNDPRFAQELKKWVKLALSLKGDHSIESESFQLEALKSSLNHLDRTESLTLLQKISLEATHDPIAHEAASLVFDQRMKQGESSLLLEPCRTRKWLKMEFMQAPCKMIVSRDLLLQGRTAEAEKLISNLKPTPAVTLLKIEIHLKQGHLDQASSEQESWLEQTGWKDPVMARSVFLHYWLNSREKTKAFFQDQHRQQSLGEHFLEPFRAALELEGSQKEKKWDETRYHHRFRMSTGSRKAATALWGLSLLTQPHRIPFQDRLVILQRIGSNWDQVDPYLQIRYLPLLHSRIESTLTSIRKNGSSIAPIRSDESSVERRVQLLRDVDMTFGKVLKLDWLGIKIKTIRELQSVYQDFISDLRKAGTPETLIQPFLSKIEELKMAENQLVSMILQPDQGYAKSTLLDPKIIRQLPESIRSSWTKAAELGQADTLHYLLSQASQLSHSDELRGIILCSLMPQVAGTEGMKLIQNKGVSR